MFELRCTVRNCTNLLDLADAGLTCAAGHHFDRAKGGYWNLTQPQDKKSLNPGDCDEAVLARHRWLERGHANGLVEQIRHWLPTEPTLRRVLDLGCGEGTFGPALFPNNASTYCGIDLSKKAIKLAARRWPEATWVLANADRGIPAASESIDLVLSLFGRRPSEEIRRTLRPGGRLIVAVPGEEDLIELREKVHQQGIRRNRCEAIINEVQTDQVQLIQQSQWKNKIQIQSDEIADALAMTYRAVRHAEQSKLAALDSAAVTLSADLLLFQKTC